MDDVVMDVAETYHLTTERRKWGGGRCSADWSESSRPEHRCRCAASAFSVRLPGLLSLRILLRSHLCPSLPTFPAHSPTRLLSSHNQVGSAVTKRELVVVGCCDFCSRLCGSLLWWAHRAEPGNGRAACQQHDALLSSMKHWGKRWNLLGAPGLWAQVCSLEISSSWWNWMLHPPWQRVS